MFNAVGGSEWPRAAVFDCDGLLVDSAHCWHGAYAALVEENDAELDSLDLAALAGASVARAATEIHAALGIEFEERRLRQLLRESFSARPPQPMRGAQALVETFSAQGPVGVASNAPLELLHVTLERLGLDDVVQAVVSAELTEAEKPEPDVYIEACRRLGVCPSDAVAFEDSPIGARSARAAGLFVVAVPSAPELSVESDLTFARLDDPRLIDYFRLTGGAQDRQRPAGDAR